MTRLANLYVLGAVGFLIFTCVPRAVRATDASYQACNYAAKLLRQSHKPGHETIGDYNPAKLPAVFDAYRKCALTYTDDQFVLFFGAWGMGYVAALQGGRAYAYAVAFVGPDAQKLRAMPRAGKFS